MNFNPYAAGKKVYSNGSYAPTRGTVDPQGYVERSMNQQISQRRSGLAMTALNRIQNQTHPGNPYGQAPMTPPKTPVKKDKPKPKPGSQEPLQQGPPIQKPHQNVQVSPNGQLNLPWNAHNALQAIAAQNLLNQQLQGNQAAMDQYRLGYQANIRNAGLANTQAQDSILDSDAGRGMAFSSGHATNVSNQATMFNDYLTQQANDKNAFRGQIQQSNTAASNDFLSKLRTMAINQGLDLEKYAGKLGLGRAKSKPDKPHHGKPGGGHGHHKPPKHHPKPHHGGGQGHGPKPRPHKPHPDKPGHTPGTKPGR